MPDFDAINTALVARFSAAQVTPPALKDYRTYLRSLVPVSYWRLGEPSGTVAADDMGVNVGTYTGSPTLGVTGALAGDPNTAVTVSAGKYVAVADANSLDFGNGPYSVGLWAKRADALGTLQLLYSKGTQGNVFFNGSKFVLDNDTSNIVQESGTTVDTAWHFFVVTRSGTGTGNNKVYKDGVDVTTDGAGIGGATVSNATNVRIGVYTDSATGPFNGSLDEVAVWGRVLTSVEVAALYASGTQVYDPIRVATGDLPGGMTPLPTVLVFPENGTFTQVMGGKRDSVNMFTLRFYYNQIGDAERDFPALRKWLDVLCDQLRASIQLGGLTWTSGVRSGEVTRAKVDSWRIGVLTYADVKYSGIELSISVLVNESLTFVA